MDFLPAADTLLDGVAAVDEDCGSVADGGGDESAAADDDDAPGSDPQPQPIVVGGDGGPERSRHPVR